jgi:hypothetical protein
MTKAQDQKDTLQSKCDLLSLKGRRGEISGIANIQMYKISREEFDSDQHVKTEFSTFRNILNSI